MDQMNHRITYLRNSRKFPVACLAYTGKNNSSLKFGVSVFNPVDKFSKIEARKIALERLINSPYEVNLSQYQMPGTKLRTHDALKYIMVEISSDKTRPTRLRKAARNYLRFSGKKEIDSEISFKNIWRIIKSTFN